MKEEGLQYPVFYSFQIYHFLFAKPVLLIIIAGRKEIQFFPAFVLARVKPWPFLNQLTSLT